jgi:hypothetical protein
MKIGMKSINNIYSLSKNIIKSSNTTNNNILLDDEIKDLNFEYNDNNHNEMNEDTEERDVRILQRIFPEWDKDLLCDIYHFTNENIENTINYIQKDAQKLNTIPTSSSSSSLLLDMLTITSNNNKNKNVTTTNNDVTSNNNSSNNNSSDNNCCCICLSSPKTILILPCKHLCLCEDCSENCNRGNNCPICRSIITDKMKIYL